jgi:hypothetical protein
MYRQKRMSKDQHNKEVYQHILREVAGRSSEPAYRDLVSKLLKNGLVLTQCCMPLPLNRTERLDRTWLYDVGYGSEQVETDHSHCGRHRRTIIDALLGLHMPIEYRT